MPSFLISLRVCGEEQKTSGLEESSSFQLNMALYELLFKRTSTLALTVVVGAFVFERSFDVLIDGIFDKINEGKQWKDIKKNYET
ncbi:Cytochrome b-c1 complex subunit 9 [Frankliniella fusca]|uniref:Cytochrome b-c1 complex subunit 9 n=1 Tax=Frankliniella fusca TaxID=407009 RepID=A0AAE1LZ49_9NEOP|nr:Cytochrome b-c1 complex subunit 9 [Frankliniella fusca]